MTLIASIITFSKKKKIGKKNVTLDPRHGTLDPRPSTKRQTRQKQSTYTEDHSWKRIAFYLSSCCVINDLTMRDSRAVSREEIPAVLFNYKTKRTVSEMFFRLKCSFINSELLVVFTLGC